MNRSILLEILKTFVVVPQDTADQAMADSATQLLHFVFEQVVAGLSDEDVNAMVSTSLDQVKFTTSLTDWINSQ